MCVLQLVETVRTFIMRYGSRLWKLRVLHAELKFTIRSERCLCDVGFHHQVGMLSVTSAFTIWLERCLC